MNMVFSPPWKAAPASRKTPQIKPSMAAVLTAADSPVPRDGHCDGFEAGRLLQTYGPAAVDAICERVAKCGGRTMTRCEGWHRTGGAFKFGPSRWDQCPADATVLLTVRQGGTVSDWPACNACWRETIARGIEILQAIPIDEEEIRAELPES